MAERKWRLVAQLGIGIEANNAGIGSPASGPVRHQWSRIIPALPSYGQSGGEPGLDGGAGGQDNLATFELSLEKGKKKIVKLKSFISPHIKVCFHVRRVRKKKFRQASSRLIWSNISGVSVMDDLKKKSKKNMRFYHKKYKKM